jgi:CheY-like chemotaxis protein
MRTAAVQASEVTSRLLECSQQIDSRQQLQDLSALLGGLSVTLKEALGSEIELQLKPVGGPLSVRVDPEQFEKLLVNLATNARDAMSVGGAFRIDVTEFEADQNFLAQFPEALPGRYASLVAADTGCGMNETVKSHLFEPFFTTKDPRRDGLGLAVCQGIVRQNGGFMRVHSVLNAGTTVELLFPLATFPAEKETPEVATSPPLHGSERVLIVDDEDPLRKMAATSLSQLGYQVIEAPNTSVAMELLRERSMPGVDVLVTDGKAESPGARALAHELHSIHPTARVLFISGYPASPDEPGIIPEFDTAALQKPFTLNQLARSLRELLDQ